MKTLLQVIDTTGPGGAETIFCCLCEQAMNDGFNVIALVRGKGWLYSELSRRGIPTHILDCKGSFNIRYLARLVGFIRRHKVDTVHAHLLGSAVYSSLASMCTRTHTVATFHGHVDISSRERYMWLKSLVIRRLCRSVVAVSPKLEAALFHHNLASAGRTRVIYNGIDVSHEESAETERRRSQFRQTYNIGDDDFVIGALGNIRRAKNYPLAVEVIARLQEKGLAARLLIAGQGSGALLESIEARIVDLGLQDYIRLLGFVEDTPSFLDALDVFMMTSKSEGQPLALLQAMSQKCAVVSTPSGVEDILEDGVSGLVASGHDPDEIADAVAKLRGDRKLAARLGDAARNVVMANYSVTAMYSSYKALY